jgi:hypothetical protein
LNDEGQASTTHNFFFLMDLTFPFFPAAGHLEMALRLYSNAAQTQCRELLSVVRG